MRAIVTGTGSIAIRHLRNLRGMFPEAELAIVSRRSAAELDQIHRDLANSCFHDMETALAAGADLAIIAGPAPFHVPQAFAALDRGVPVLVEKPLATTSAEAESLVAAARGREVPVLVGYCLRYHPLVQELQRRVAAGELGRLYTLRADVGQYLPNWRPQADYRRSVTAQRSMGGGALLELSHEIDLVRTIFGLPEMVTAVAGRISELEIDVEDVVEVVTRHRLAGTGERVIASIHLDLFRRAPRRALILDGERGSLELDLLGGQLTWRQPDGTARSESVPAGFAINDLYLAEIADLLRSSKQGSMPLASLADGFATLRIAEAAAKAAREERTVKMSEE
jgi:predicted dehydrogenase